MIEEIFSGGGYDLSSGVTALNTTGLRAPDSGTWDADHLAEQFELLGD